MILLDKRPETPPATVTCPDCAGRGETVIRSTIEQDPITGAWDADWRTCTGCDGTGSVSEDDAAVCTRCDNLTIWLGHGCIEHNDVCQECRPRGCGDCANDGDFDPESYYGGVA